MREPSSDIRNRSFLSRCRIVPGGGLFFCRRFPGQPRRETASARSFLLAAVCLITGWRQSIDNVSAVCRRLRRSSPGGSRERLLTSPRRLEKKKSKSIK